MPNTYGRVLIATLAWGVLAFGAVYPWAYWPLATACFALGVWGIVVTEAWQDPRARTLAIAVGAVLAASGLQLVALPYSVIAALSPALDRFFRDYELGYHPSALHSVSLSPGATLVVWGLAIAFGTLLVGLVRGIRMVRLEWLVSQIMGLGMGMALVGTVLRAFNNEKDPRVYGFWQPIDGGNPFGPFVNRNHFAGWMVMTVPVVAMYSFALLQRSLADRGGRIGGWASWASTVEGNRFLLVAFASLIMGASLVLTGSRSGVASFAVVVLVMIGFMVSRVRGRKKQLVAAGYLALVLVGAIGWAGFGMVASRFGKAGGELEGRFTAWRDTIHMIHDFPVFGIGLGSFGRAMLVYQTSNRDSMYIQAHNDYLQVAAEGGLLVGIPALALAGVIGLGIVRRLRSADDDITTFWIRRGAVAGLIGIAAQSIVEFSLQMPGNTAWFILLLALALHRPRPIQNANRV